MRIKITGYIDSENLDADQLDADHESGLSVKGHEDLTTYYGSGPGLKIADLEDVEVEAQP